MQPVLYRRPAEAPLGDPLQAALVDDEGIHQAGTEDAAVPHGLDEEELPLVVADLGQRVGLHLAFSLFAFALADRRDQKRRLISMSCSSVISSAGMMTGSGDSFFVSTDRPPAKSILLSYH